MNLLGVHVEISRKTLLLANSAFEPCYSGYKAIGSSFHLYVHSRYHCVEKVVCNFYVGECSTKLLREKF